MKKKILSGKIKRHPDGFGFFIPDDHEFPDVYIPKHCMFGVMTNDHVSIEVKQEKGKDRYSGEILRVLERATEQVIGRYSATGDGGQLYDTSHVWGSNIQIAPENSKNAKSGELVVVKILKYADERQKCSGEVIQILGNADDPLHDTKKVIVDHQIPHKFGNGIEEELNQIPDKVLPSDKTGRTDLTALPLITIDGATAKDFDDAIYVESSQNGFRIVVAIADVSHYVKPDSKIDDEAYKRGTSTYFPNYVVPMLPEKLSNGLCSLNPEVERLALVADIQLDFKGEFLGTNFYEAVIQSHARVTYGEAQEVLDGYVPDKLKDVSEVILKARDVAKILMSKRFREGSLAFDLPESEIVVDDAGFPVDIQRAERLFSHKLIEELMLIANVAVAKYLKNKDIPGIHRIHEEPNAEAIGTLNKFIVNFGGKSTSGQGKLQNRISKALEFFKDTPKEGVLSMLTLRSMKQAKYSADPIGHFGLGFEDYVHFTSPIRRYPDLLIHRQIKSLIIGTDQYKAIPIGKLDSSGVHLSACEQRSVKAERQLWSIKKARLMENVIGQEFDGVISSVTKFGIFVALRDFDVDGLVKLENLGDDRFEFDDEHLCLRGRGSGVVFNLGDEIRIRVLSVDVELGQIDFERLGEKLRGNSDNRATDRKKFKDRGKTKRNRKRFR